MNNTGGLGISAAIILITFILIAATATSVMMGNSHKKNQFDYKKIVEDTVDGITSYLQIKEVLGKYYTLNNEKYIQKIAILIKPLYSTDIDISHLTMQITDGKQIQFLIYNGNKDSISTSSLFDYPSPKEEENGFYLFVVHDTDESIIQYDTINDNTDLVYLVIQLTKDIILTKGEKLQISLLPQTGTIKSITVEAPLPMQQIVTLL
jgi:archaellin